MKNRLKVLVLAATVCFLTLGALYYFESGGEKNAYTMVNVGGQSNKCSCSQRLER